MNPYEELPETAFWRPAIGSRSPFDISGLWQPKYELRPSGSWVTFGSCFAQHLSRALVKSGFAWKNHEKAPSRVLAKVASEYNYGVFSARTGNIYTSSLLLQWMKWATGAEPVPEEVWERPDGRLIDPFRPVVEPRGFASIEELRASQQATLDAFRACMTDSAYFVFTMGLTESWHNVDGYEYPMCPGTVGGDFDPQRHKFSNMGYNDIYSTMSEAIALLRSVNRRVRVLLTVSPVPLTATMSGHHVLVATMQSKSLLRSVAGYLQGRSPYIDYFPSYEIINSAPFKGMFFEPNMRSVNPRGVAFVMEEFFRGAEIAAPTQPKDAARALAATAKASAPAAPARSKSDDEVVCEEELLEAFGSGVR